MSKKVNFGTKPADKSPSLEDWVSNRTVSHEQKPVIKMKRLTLDIPEPLHRAIKRKAADEGVPMADMLRSLLEQHYGQSE